MKKTYINPEIRDVLMDAEDLMGTSQNPQGFDGELDNTNTINTGQMLSRRNNVWGDDEVDEDF